jgi:protein KRI1
VDEEPDDFLTLRTKGKEEVEKEDEEYRNFLLESMASGVGDSVHKFKDLAVKNENSEDAFLWDYILNRGWVDKEAKRMPTYDEIIDEIEEDEEAVEEADEFERKHNFRFEEE